MKTEATKILKNSIHELLEHFKKIPIDTIESVNFATVYLKHNFMKRITAFLLSFILGISIAFSSQLSGNVNAWSMDDFIGFDPAGDGLGLTGDITSVFARIEANSLMMRITFNDMVTRSSNEIISDNFQKNNIHLQIILQNKTTSQKVVDSGIEINSISFKSHSLEYLRTPESNLLEIAFPWNNVNLTKEDLNIKIIVMTNSRVEDSFIGNGSGTKDGGNCAFVHHGNQGLTYTDVFYGNAYGISGLDGSGYDEVLQAHIATRMYQAIFTCRVH